jgi:hypothetical protein
LFVEVRNRRDGEKWRESALIKAELSIDFALRLLHEDLQVFPTHNIYLPTSGTYLGLSLDEIGAAGYVREEQKRKRLTWKGQENNQGRKDLP